MVARFCRIGISFLIVDGEVDAIDVEGGAGRHGTGIHRDHVVRVGSDCRGGTAGVDGDAVVRGIAGIHGEAAAEAGGANVADEIVDDLVCSTALIEGARLRQECGIDRQGVIAAGAAD